jgi:hypothetical protein
VSNIIQPSSRKYKLLHPRDRFFRDPHWRFNDARGMIDGVQTSRSARNSDKLVKSLARYLRAERSLSQRGYTEAEVCTKLYPEFGPIVLAAEFWNNRDNLGGIAMQAYLLTELTDADIAVNFGIETEVVSTFVNLFFDVRDRLQSVNYIAGCVLGPVFQSGIDSINPLMLSRYFGYFGGSLVLQRVLYGLSKSATLSSDDEVLGYLENVTRFNTTVQAAVMVTVHQPSKFDLRALIEGYAAIKGMEKDSAANLEQSWTAEVISAMQRARKVPRTLAESRAYQEETGILFNKLVTEPRSHEKQAVVDGLVPASELLVDPFNG